MKAIIRRLGAGLLGALFLVAALLPPLVPASAQPFPQPRQFQTQQTHYLRHLITINATSFSVDNGVFNCVFAAGTCSVRVAALPYNSFVVRGFVQPAVVCNAATTCTLSLGTASAGTQIVNAQDIKGAGTAGVAMTIVAANLGIAATGNGITATGAAGGFDVFVTVTFTGAAPSTGTVVWVLEYFGPNDGACINAPIGGTATAC